MRTGWLATSRCAMPCVMRCACWVRAIRRRRGRHSRPAPRACRSSPHDPELDALARFWLDQARAWYDVRHKDPAGAEARLRRSMDSETRLEQVHGYDLMHIGRIHTVHLWLRVQVAGGAREAALDGANAILAYVNGFGSDLPLGTGWSKEAASRIPADLAAAMTRRVASEVGTMVGGLDQEHCAGALDRLPALDRLAPEVHDEIVDWARIKRAWSDGRTDDFLGRVIPYMTAGRRETCLWHAALLDLCRAARALRPGAAGPFCAEVAERAREDPAVPRGLRHELEGLTEEPPAAPWVATMPARRFHLVCVGLPRSGVVSLFTLFGNFRAANEYAETETIRVLVDYHKGRLAATRYVTTWPGATARAHWKWTRPAFSTWPATCSPT